MKEFKGTKGNWYIQFMGDDFWVKSDYNDIVHYGTDIMADDYGEHNGYPTEQRLADTKLIAKAKELLKCMQEAIEWDNNICPADKPNQWAEKGQKIINEILD